MVPTRADRCCYELYSIQSRERTWKQNNSTQWHGAGNILTEPRVRAEVDAAFEKMLDPIAGSPAAGKSVARNHESFSGCSFRNQVEPKWTNV